MEKKIGVYINFLDEKAKQRIDQKAEECGFCLNYFTKSPEAQDIKDCEVLFGQIPPKLLKEAKALKWLQCSFAGVDKYSDENLYAGNVTLTNASGAYGITISEHIMCVLLMLMRRFPEYGELKAKRQWKLIGEIDSIFNSTIAVIGMGDIGSNFAVRAKALGANIIGVRRTLREKPQWCSEQYETKDITRAVKNCDAVVFALPSTRETNKLANEEFFSAMKDSSYFINVGRGSAVDEKALSAALRCGKLKGAAIDVAENEPLPKDHFLWESPNLIITPHCSGNMSLSITRQIVIDIFLENLELYFKGEELKHKVDKNLGY